MSAPVQPVVHTPGPWTLGDENNQCCEVLLGGEHNLTIDLDRQDNNTGKFVIERDEMLANARLIAAAPRMKDALRKFVAYHDADHESMSASEIQAMYDAAIDAAKDALPEVV